MNENWEERARAAEAALLAVKAERFREIKPWILWAERADDAETNLGVRTREAFDLGLHDLRMRILAIDLNELDEWDAVQRILPAIFEVLGVPEGQYAPVEEARDYISEEERAKWEEAERVGHYG